MVKLTLRHVHSCAVRGLDGWFGGVRHGRLTYVGLDLLPRLSRERSVAGCGVLNGFVEVSGSCKQRAGHGGNNNNNNSKKGGKDRR
jgi:hypothetical protein